jgi:hypothetical protein
MSKARNWLNGESGWLVSDEIKIDLELELVKQLEAVAA